MEHNDIQNFIDAITRFTIMNKSLDISDNNQLLEYLIQALNRNRKIGMPIDWVALGSLALKGYINASSE